MSGRATKPLHVLFTLLPATGSLHPLLPLASELQARGHAVKMLSSASFGRDIERHGMASASGGLDFLFSDARYFQILLAEAGVEFPNLTGDERFGWVVDNLFIRVAAKRMLPDAVDFARRWRADLIVRESLEFSGCVAAEHLGIAHASVAAAADSALDRSATWAPALAELRANLGLAPTDASAMVYRHLHICFTPPSFDGPGARFPSTAMFFRHLDAAPPVEAMPAWLRSLSRSPTVLVSLGTVFYRMPGVYEAILEALAGEQINLLVASGADEDPARFGSQPANVHIERYLPISSLLPTVDLFVTHGGFNSVKESLSAGTPMVVIPLGGDQHYAAARCEALGVGVAVPPNARTPSSIRAAALQVLGEPRYRDRAAAIRAEIRALPDVGQAVGLLERLGRRIAVLPA